ncbi:thioesterase family protein [Whalleya microplaca]|nr:thioesterase family protein [Whalleya microplaca]
MALDNTGWACVPFSDATKIEKLDSHTYGVNLNENYCVGAVPNGGYAASCMLAAASMHLSSRDQPDTLTAHFEYLGRTFPGPAIVVIEDVKLSKSQLSTLQLTLWQGGLQSQKPWITPSVSRRFVIAYSTHTDLRTFGGLSMPTGYESSPAAALPDPLPDFKALKNDAADDAWEETKLPAASGPMHSLRNWRFYLPRAGPLTPGMLDMWIRATSGKPITQAALPYVVDSFPFNSNAYLAAPEMRQLLLGPSPRDPDHKSSSGGKAKEDRDEEGQVEARASLWFPTVVMNLETKMALPEEGAEWLAVRVTSKQIKDGKFDLEVLVRDVEGDMVALSHHVALIVSIEKNTAKREPSTKASL